MADEVAICLPIIETLLNICSSTTYNQSFSSLGINLSSWPLNASYYNEKEFLRLETFFHFG